MLPGTIKFHRKKRIGKKHCSRVSCTEVRMKTIIWEYICWVLGGKPKDHLVSQLDWVQGKEKK